ncbi:hypothetical protein DRN98_09435 [Methanosarcinales archaeon]|nr:MAG: hypothetical protein DRN98_09435 [Methanosarcinales archaeon]
MLEVCALVIAPSTCDFLAEFGAEVIKLEQQGVIFKWNPKVPSQGPPLNWDGNRNLRHGG